MLLQLEVIQDLVVGEEWSVDEETLVVSVDVIGSGTVLCYTSTERAGDRRRFEARVMLRERGR